MIDTFLYYAIIVDVTILAAIATLSSQQYNATDKTYMNVRWFLDYVATHTNAKIRYHASDMVLRTHSNASYLSAPQARSRAGGNLFSKNLFETPPLNGPIHTVYKIMSNVMGSAAEVEIGATYINGQELVPIRTCLHKMGHPQSPTPMQVDNTTAEAFANNTPKQKLSKAINMRVYWIQDRTKQGHFKTYWQPGDSNTGDYHTKHHSPNYHRLMRHVFLHTNLLIAQLSKQTYARVC